MAKLTPTQAAQMLYVAGFRGEDLVRMVGIAGRESAYDPTAHRTDNPSGKTGDFGLLQINYVNAPRLIQAGIIKNVQDLLDPMMNAKAAFFLYKQSGLKPWAAATGGWNANGDPLFNVDMAAARAAVENASKSGILGNDYATGAGVALSGTPSGTVGAPATAGGAFTGPLTLPPDAKLYNNGFGVFAVFDVGGVNIHYGVNVWNGSVQLDMSKVQNVSAEQWAAMNSIEGGDAEELRTVTTDFGSFKGFFDKLLAEVFGPGNAAQNDPEVRRVLAEYAARPDMSNAELQNKLQTTQWYQTHTTSELDWNGLSQAEQQKRRDDMAATMSATWLQFTGENVAPDDPRISNYLEDLASGKRTIGAWTETVVKSQALTNGESPWSRQQQDEQEAQRQRGVDVENTAQRVRDLARRWGVKWSEGEYQRWATGITSKTMSEADLLGELKQQAQVLYPWKSPDMETATAASPWVEKYKTVMEKEADMFDPQIQSALNAGQPIWEFEQGLKRSSGWLQTKNARDSIGTSIGNLGRLMGFS